MALLDVAEQTGHAYHLSVMEPSTYRMYIGGRWTEASSGEYFESDDPYRGKPWALIPRGTPADVECAVAAAHHAFTSGAWPKLTASRRGALLRRLGDLVTEIVSEPRQAHDELRQRVPVGRGLASHAVEAPRRR